MLEQIVMWVAKNPAITLVGAFTLIQITPIKVNPWSVIMRFIKRALVGDIEADLKTLKTEFEQERIENIRWNILDYANSCRNKRKHSKEEWNHCINQLKMYETYCEIHHINNGVIEEDAKYLRELYHCCCVDNGFL